MALDEAKIEYLFGQFELINDRLDVVIKGFEQERADIGRMFEVHGQSIENRAQKAIREEIGMLGCRLDEKIDLLFEARQASQGSELKRLCEDMEEMRIQVDGIDTRTRDFPLMRGKIEQLESRPGLMAIKAWQWLAAGGVAAAGLVLSIVQWVIPKK